MTRVVRLRGQQLKKATDERERQVAAAHTMATEVVGRHNVWMACGDMLVR